MEQILDMFGDPVPEYRDPRGRPEHVPTQEKRNLIIQLLAFGWTMKRIAGAIGLTEKTLRKHYSRELKVRDVARDRVEAARLSMLWTEMRKGNVAAMREYGRLVERADLAAVERSFEERDAEPRRAIGKKEAAQLAAATAGEDSDWGTDLVGPGDGRVLN